MPHHRLGLGRGNGGSILDERNGDRPFTTLPDCPDIPPALQQQAQGYIRAIRYGGERPVAVPLIEDAAAVAAAEAESVMGHDDPAHREQA